MINYPASTRRRRALFGRLLPLGTVAVLTFALAPRAGAQRDQAGRVEGVVYDSVHARPLAAVRVVAVRADSQAGVRAESMSDSAGRYHIDSLPPGRYSLGFESALLDSLEIVLPPRAVTVAAGSSATVRLAMSPATKLRAALCPGVTLGEGSGVVYGHVVSAETEGPLVGAVVALQWRELAVWDSAGSKTLRPVSSARSASVITDDGGWYRACGVPTGTWVSMQLQRDGRFGPVLRSFVDDTLGIAIRHISYSSTAARDSGEFADSSTMAPFTGTAGLTGVVRGPEGQPIPSAMVHLLETRGTAVTDLEGRYTLSGLPAGTHALEVRRIGYSLGETWVDLRSGVTKTNDLRLKRVVTLDSVRVVAMRTRYPEFSEHQKQAVGGRFLGPDQILRRHPVRTSDLVRSLGAFIVETRGSRTIVYSSRGGGTRPCIVNIVINGFAAWGDDPNAVSIDDVHPSQVGAIEAYSQGSAPPEYSHGCGAIAIWTKR